MGLISGLYAGTEGLVSHAQALAAVSDNIANTNTTGYKPGRAEFGDILADSIGSLYGSPIAAGNGSLVEQLAVQHSIQGTLEDTGRTLDAGIDGTGYFVINNGQNNLYTRAGNFITDADGNLETVTGESVMGFLPADPATLVPLTTAGVGSTPVASAASSALGNLDASSAITTLPPAGATGAQISQLASFQSTIQVIDSLGASHDVGLNFYHTGVGTWTVQAYADGADVGGVAGTPTQVGTTDLTFDAQGLQAAGAAPLTLTPAWANGAAAGNVAVDLSGFTGFSGFSAVTSLNVDGVPSGTVNGFGFRDDGTFVANMSNGQEVVVGQLAMATFNSPTNLDRVGNNNFAETGDSGVPDIGVANTEARGKIKGSSLEQSAVDTAKEFVDLIRFQRGYQANTQVIQTLSEVVNTTIQIA